MPLIILVTQPIVPNVNLMLNEFFKINVNIILLTLLTVYGNLSGC